MNLLNHCYCYYLEIQTTISKYIKQMNDYQTEIEQNREQLKYE
jgi:hypothetical protein